MTRYYYHGWTSEEDRELFDFMTAGLLNRKKHVELVREAAEKLGRTKYACQNRWYSLKRTHDSKAV